MTRKQAIRLVVEYLDDSPELTENLCKAKEKLRELLNGIPGKIWDDETIRLAIERFISEHGRPPKVKELDTVEYLPPHPSVCQQYHMTAGRWLHENYPVDRDENWRFRYEAYSRDDFLNTFIREYRRISPDSCLTYNRKRDLQTPSWQYIAKMCGVEKWSELKALCGERIPKTRKGEKTFSVKSEILNLDNL